MKPFALVALLSMAVLGLGAAPDPAAKPLGAGEALLVMELEGSPYLGPSAVHQVAMAAYAPGDGKFLGDLTGGGYVFMNTDRGQRGRRLAAGRARYGSYVLRSAGLQYWVECYNGGAWRFDVEPGQIVFLGRFQAEPSLRRINEAVRGGLMPPALTRSFYLFDTPRPAYTPPDQLPGWEERIAAELAERYPAVKGRLVAGRPQALTFAPASRTSCGDARSARRTDRIGATP